MSLRIVISIAFLLATQVAVATEPKAFGTDQQHQLLKQKVAELDRLQHEIQQLREATGTPAQIRVDVQMLEVNLTKLRDLGIDTTWFATGHITSADLKQAADKSSNEGSQRQINDSAQFVNWLREQNLAKSLASPAVVVLSGQPASFHVGGNFPIPTSGDGSAGVAFRNFGTELKISALALGDKQVRLEYVARVSTINMSHAIEIDGIQVPPMDVLEVDSGCELLFGQTAIMAGLVKQRVEAQERAHGQAVEKLVEVGFMVVITPELIQPAESLPVAKR